MEEFRELCMILLSCRRPPHGSESFRYLLTFLLFCSLCLAYAHRVCLSVTIVAMMDHPPLADDDPPSCRLLPPLNATEQQGEYRWRPSIQGLVLGAYFLGFAWPRFGALGGWLEGAAGEKPLVGLSLLISSFLTLATPVAADIGPPSLFLLRFMLGMVHGVCMPTAFSLFARWGAVDERSTFGVLGDHVGTVLAMPLAGYLCQYGFAGGWPSVYYILGGIGCICSALWLCLVHNRPPDEDLRISSSGVFYIQRNIQSTGEEAHELPAVGWPSLLRSAPVWSVSLASFCGTWGYTTLLTKLPTYLEVVLRVPIQKNGLVNSLVYVSTCASVFLSGYLSDYLVKKKKKMLSPTAVRKAFESVAMFLPALCTALIPMVTCDRAAVITLLSASMAFLGFAGGGHASIAADMDPQHVASIYGLSSTVGCTAGILSPLLAGLLLDNAHASVDQWSLVFYISSGFYFFGGCVFLLFASAERQSWGQIASTKSPSIPYFFSEAEHLKPTDEKTYGAIN